MKIPYSKVTLITSISILLFAISNVGNANQNTNNFHVNDAESGSMIFKFDDKTSIMQIALDTSVKMNINGSVNRVIVEQVFTNPSDMWVEGVYVFPLPEDSAVDQLRMYVDERIIQGQIHEKEAAKKIYEDAKNAGKSASLVEQQRPNIFTTNVANIAPGATIKVAIEYQQAVLIDNNTYSIKFPVRIEVNLTAGFDLASLNSTYHKVRAESINQMTNYITLDEVAQLDQDFELTWSANLSHEPEIALFAQESGDSVYLMMMAIPPKNDVFKRSDRPRELIFIIDSSGSMSGGSMVQAKESLYAALERLKPTDRFNIIDFDSTFEPLYDSAQMATEPNMNYAKRFIRKIDADGGTEMYKPIDFALKSRDSESKNYLRQIVFITDGQSSNEASIFNNVSYNIKNDRFFTIGIGSAPNSYLLTKLADFGRGAFTFIGSQAAVSQKMNRLFEKLESPALTDIQVNFPPEITSELAKDVIYDLYAGETITAVFKMNALPDSLKIYGRTIDGEFNKMITIDKLSSTKGIDILWARRKIDRLTDFYNNTYSSSIKQSAQQNIISLALDYHLVSRFTSLVAVDITPSRPENEELITQAIIKKAKADGLEGEVKLNEDGQLQNRDELMLALMKTLPEDKVKNASAQKQFEMVMRSANVPPSVFAAMQVPDKVAALVKTPVKMVPSSQTATFSELFIYIGLSLLIIAFALRRRVLL